MPKISVHGGATNARVADVSPAADASQPQDVAEDVLGRPTSEDKSQEPVVEAAPEPEAAPIEESTLDYDGMTLAELREAATTRELPSYGTKAQLIERLRENDAS